MLDVDGTTYSRNLPAAQSRADEVEIRSSIPVAYALASSPVPLNMDELAARFMARGVWKKRLPQLLEMLVTMGRAQESEGRYSGINH